MQYAIDIVLFPPAHIMAYAFALNARAYAQGNAAVQLGRTDFIPHLSLLMGVMDEHDTKEIYTRMARIATDFPSIPVTISSVHDSWMEADNTGILRALHSRILQDIDPLLSHQAKNDDFIHDVGEKITPDCYPWVNEFSTKFSEENYRPHITIGNPGEHPEFSLPLSFEASDIAVCQLGRYNTCRKVLWSTQ